MTVRGKLKQISESTLCEADPPKDRTRPLEWQRRGHLVDLPLHNLKITRRYGIQEFDSLLLEGIYPKIETFQMFFTSQSLTQ